MKLNPHILALIAVGSSVAANCQSCLEHSVGTALECGADGQEIAEAIAIGKRVRQGAAASVDSFAVQLNSVAPSIARATNTGYGCAS